MKIKDLIIGSITFLILSTLLVYSERYPLEAENPYYNILINFFNVSHTENGTIKAGLNISSYDLNITNKLFVNKINASIMNITNITADNITATRFTGLLDCGMLTGGSDGDFCVDATAGAGESSSAYWQRVNTSDFLGASDSNGSLLRNINISSFPFSKFTSENVSNASNLAIKNGTPANLTNLNVFSLNGTALSLFNKSIDLSTYNKSISLVNYNQSISLVNYNQSISLNNYNQSILLDTFNDIVNFLKNVFFYNSAFIRGNLTVNSSGIFTVNGTVAGTGFDVFTRVGDFKIENISNHSNFPLSNFQLGNVSNYSQFVKGVDFNIGNISNYTQYQRSSDFNLGNISNLTKTSSFSILLGNFTTVNSSNVSATNITATRFTGLLDCGMLSGGSDGDFCADTSGASDVVINMGNISNYSQFVKGVDFNIGNISNYSQFVKGIDFNLGNISNKTIFNGTQNDVSFGNIFGNATKITNLTIRNTNITFGDGMQNGFTIYFQKKQCNATCMCEYINETIISRDCFA